MKSMHGKIQSFLIIAISFWVGMDPIYRQSNNLSEIDFFSPIPALEILDQEDLLGPEENKAKIFSLRVFFAFSLLWFSSCGPFSLLSFHLLSFDHRTSMLRC